jgi:hypothetical protein
MRTALLSLLPCLVLSQGADHGTCGWQCTSDEQCGGCFTAGKCSQPDAGREFPEISSTCVSAPADPPADPPALPADATWPDQWASVVESWTYAEFDTTDEEATQAFGKFYYDGIGEHSRAEWTPYIDGNDGVQVWVANAEDSRYYVQAGRPALCIYFTIRDPVSQMPISIEQPNWIESCDENGIAEYHGREEEVVNGETVWVDHWGCRLDYTEANETIHFQNWHTIDEQGCGRKGLPVRVTGGNSDPNAEEGAPRLNTVWYYNFTFDLDDSLWIPPDGSDTIIGSCIGVSPEEAEAHFGYKPSRAHLMSHDFHRRAHHLPHAAPTDADVARARQPKPRRKYKGHHFGEAMNTLNAVLLGEPDLATKQCDEFTLAELFAVEDVLFFARSHELQGVYAEAKDTRNIAHETIASLRAEQRDQKALVALRPDLEDIVRDGVCHEAVMWYVHHTSEEAKAEVRELITLPLLPEAQHPPQPEHDAHASKAHARYTKAVSCAICHVE